MTESATEPRATRPAHFRVARVWIIPAVAAFAAAWVVVERRMSEGPTITISFKSASGIEAGKTAVRYKDVRIGEVATVQLSDGHNAVEVTANITKSAAGLMVEDAQFWIVRPRLTVNEVSGLGTLLSGSYITLESGRSERERRNFSGLEAPPLGEGSAFVLKARDAASLSAGAPVYFRRVMVGQVISSDLAPDGDSVDIKVFVSRPYDRFVRQGTRFWNAGGFDVSLGANGVEIRSPSLASVIAGGIAFDTTQTASGEDRVAPPATFALYSSRSEALKRAPDGIRYVLYFDESLRGLVPGAPVTFLGLGAGEVVEVGLVYDSAQKTMRPRVEVVLVGDGLLEKLPSGQIGSFTGAKADSRRKAVFHRMVEERGLRAQLRSANLLSGQQYVALEIFPRAAKAKVDWAQAIPELPTVASSLPDLETKLAAVLEKVERLPLEGVVADARLAFSSLKDTLDRTGALAGKVDAEVVPQLAAALERASRLMQGVDEHWTGAGAPVQQDLVAALEELTQTARALKALAEVLERNPESIIWGRPKQGK